MCLRQFRLLCVTSWHARAYRTPEAELKMRPEVSKFQVLAGVETGANRLRIRRGYITSALASEKAGTEAVMHSNRLRLMRTMVVNSRHVSGIA